jgi:hypothetical protein
MTSPVNTHNKRANSIEYSILAAGGTGGVLGNPENNWKWWLKSAALAVLPVIAVSVVSGPRGLCKPHHLRCHIASCRSLPPVCVLLQPHEIAFGVLFAQDSRIEHAK